MKYIVKYKVQNNSLKMRNYDGIEKKIIEKTAKNTLVFTFFS